MELLSGNLQIVEIGKINRKNGRYVAPDLKMPVYIFIHCMPFDVFNTEQVFF